MITTQEAFDMARSAEASQLEKAKAYIEKRGTFIEKTIREAAQKGEYSCRIYFTKRESKKLSIDYSHIALAMSAYLYQFGNYSVTWAQDIDNDLEFRISWRRIK